MTARSCCIASCLSRRAWLAGAGAAALAACAPRPRRGRDGARPHRSELDADLGQIVWAGIPGPTIAPALADALAGGALGAVVLFRRNVETLDLAGVRGLADALHDAGARAGVPLLVAVDQEGGRVQTVREPATRWPAMARLGAAGDPALARAVGRAMGAELAALGVDVDLAPVLDVLVDPDNTVIGDRALSADPARVTALGGALAAGLGEAGVLPCGKHFPGHGGSRADSHAELPVSVRSRAELDAAELPPFRALAPTLPLLMSAHVAYRGLGFERPATLEPRLMSELLRGELGFRGVLVSDDLGMSAVAAGHGPVEAARLALLAGCDALLFAHRGDWLEAAWRGLRAAATVDAAVRARVREAAARVRALKAIPRPPPPPLEAVDFAAHRRLAASV